MRRQQGRKKNTKNKRVTKRSERNQGEQKGDKKGRHLEMNQNNPSSGGKNNVFPPTKKNEGLKANCPKTHVQCGRCPQSQEECEQKKKTPKQKEGGVKRTTWSLRKRGRTKKNGKDAKTLRTAAAMPFSPTTPSPTEKLTRPARTTARQICACARHNARKTLLQNDPRLCSPQRVFEPQKPNFVKKSNFWK